jgi:hypothetical protein
VQPQNYFETIQIYRCAKPAGNSLCCESSVAAGSVNHCVVVKSICHELIVQIRHGFTSVTILVLEMVSG